MSRILLVEDHGRMAALIRKALERAGISVDVCEGLEAAWSASRQLTYGAMVVDRGLPDGDGLTFVKRCRASGVHTPCLISHRTRCVARPSPRNRGRGRMIT